MDNGKRQPTNVWATYVSAGFVVFLLAFFGYVAYNGSIFRMLNGVDDCGNICGRDNSDNGLASCGSHDKRSLPLTQVDFDKDPNNSNITITRSQCVKSCSEGYKEISNRCTKIEGEVDAIFTSVMQEIVEDLSKTWTSMLMTCVVAFVFSYVLLMLFRYAIKYVIWIIYIGIVGTFAIGSIVMVVMFFVVSASDDPQQNGSAFIFLIVSGVLAVLAIILGLILYFMRKRIQLVVKLFKEASKALIDIPFIIVEPILTFVALGLTCTGFIYFVMLIESSGSLKVIHFDGKFDRAVYEKNAVMSVAKYLNTVAFMWFTSFILGCQHFIIAGTVCQWFFTHTKDKLDSPIKRSFSYLLRFHIGSVCFGSILITLVKLLRKMLKSIEYSKDMNVQCIALTCSCCLCCLSSVLEMFETLLKYIIRNAYIIVALNGTSLIESGKKAFNLITKNVVDVIVLNKFGDFVLAMGKVFVVVISGFVCYELVNKTQGVHFWFIPVILSMIFAFLIVHCFLTVFEMTVDTIYVCFCEDCEINDGVTRPFFMSRGLMEVMQELKNAAGGQFNFNQQKPGDEAGQQLLIPAGWKFGNQQ